MSTEAIVILILSGNIVIPLFSLVYFLWADDVDGVFCGMTAVFGACVGWLLIPCAIIVLAIEQFRNPFPWLRDKIQELKHKNG